MTSLAAWANGRLLEPGEAAVAPDDPAFTVGRGLFETLLVRDGTVLDTAAHLARLRSSARTLGFVPVDTVAIEDGIAAVAAQAPPGPARLRYTVSATGAVVVTLAAIPEPPASVTVRTAPWPRNERSPLVAHKTTSYGECAWALEWAQAFGADEALFVNACGRYCEGATSNLFAAHNGTVFTPALADGLLPGITRAKVLRAAVALGYRVRLAPLTVLAGAQEIFLTSSLKGVVPVTRVDDHPVAPGPVAAALRNALLGPP